MRATLLTIATIISVLSPVPPAVAAVSAPTLVAQTAWTPRSRAAAIRVSRRTRMEQERARRSTARAQATKATKKVEPQPGPVNTAALRTKTPVYDTLEDTAVRSRIAVLGTVTPSLAGVRLFSNQEPIDATAVVITFDVAMQSVSQVLVYDETARLLGAATVNTSDTTGRSYRLPLPTGMFQLPHRKEVSLYVRARLKTHDAGGQSGEALRVDSVLVEGNGAWSNESYLKASADTFPASQIARGRIDAIENASGPEAILVPGTGQQLGAFRFRSQRSDNGARIRVTDLRFQIESYGGVSLGSVELRPEGTSEGAGCSVVSGEVVCSAIPSSVGTLDDATVLRLYGDVAVAGAGDAFLRLTINDPGSYFDAGAVTWTDGTSSVTWVDFDQPVARGTAFKR